MPFLKLMTNSKVDSVSLEFGLTLTLSISLIEIIFCSYYSFSAPSEFERERAPGSSALLSFPSADEAEAERERRRLKDILRPGERAGDEGSEPSDMLEGDFESRRPTDILLGESSLSSIE